MGIEKGIITESAKRDSPLSDNQQQHTESFLFRHLPLWLCLLLALIIRAWLVYHTHGVIDGDEAMVGIQAQHILRGELPVYFISQAYMGSLEAYLMALLFAIAGSSVWTLRAEPVLLSLLLVWLTWKLAAILADAAKLPPYAKRRFMIIATLLAALPPLYDAIIELRTLGGYIETFVLMLFLLISAFRLTQRWREGGSLRELALRWVRYWFYCWPGFLGKSFNHLCRSCSRHMDCWVLSTSHLVEKEVGSAICEAGCLERYAGYPKAVLDCHSLHNSYPCMYHWVRSCSLLGSYQFMEEHELYFKQWGRSIEPTPVYHR